MTTHAPRCPLCHAVEPRSIGPAHGRDYLECDACGLTFREPSQRPTPEEERERYEEHRNDLADPGYRAHLDRLVAPLVARLEPGARGLDYGSGPTPALSQMLREAGFPTVDYDPFFAPDAAVLSHTYDFVTCVETAEHFFDPASEFERLDGLLVPGGLLGVMTTLRTDRPFAEWWYVRDVTHVCFYRARTMQWIGELFGWDVRMPADNVVLFRKPPA